MPEAAEIKVGDVVRGFGWGFFGRDSIDDKECIQVGVHNGIRYAVFATKESFFVSPITAVSGHELDRLEALQAEAAEESR
ncbi:hypothetical protein [Leifsonia sp. Leaf264]|uniref:hypothetical protein n=1 Tax=Leifsonia sp. Leaf264 TaxID=1736314 RepID=UPI0006F36013|nr:hypothetical protein [Leifsonia sp. Leaf264]KQO98569.1 hypothetical protein ASF30_10940 [Leifsonia sp. Leaf264]